MAQLPSCFPMGLQSIRIRTLSVESLYRDHWIFCPSGLGPWLEDRVTQDCSGADWKNWRWFLAHRGDCERETLLGMGWRGDARRMSQTYHDAVSIQKWLNFRRYHSLKLVIICVHNKVPYHCRGTVYAAHFISKWKIHFVHVHQHSFVLPYNIAGNRSCLLSTCPYCALRND